MSQPFQPPTQEHIERIPTTPLPRPSMFPEESQRYRTWLNQEAQKQPDWPAVRRYTEEATTSTQNQGKEVATYAPFHQDLSALQTVTPWQIAAAFLIVALWLVSLLFLRVETLAIAISLLTFVYTGGLVLNLVLILRASWFHPEIHISDEVVAELADAPWPIYTVLCPLYKEKAVIPQFVRAMRALDYPPDRLQVLFLTEQTDHETRAALRGMRLPASFEVVIVPDGQPRTKPRACNYGLLYARGSYLVIYDAEDIPDPLQLKKAVLAFAQTDVKTLCVQAKLHFYNSTQNLLTRWFTAEYSTWFGLVLPSLQRANFALPLGGTSNHFRADALRALGAWDAYNVTEDCDLGLRIKKFGMKTVILDSTTMEEANPNLKNWLRQRSRWIKGYMQTYLVHMRHPLRDLRTNWQDFLSFQVVIGSGVGLLFVNPLMWFFLLTYTLFGPQVVNLYHVLFPGPVLYAGAFCLIFGNFFYIYLSMYACARRGEYALVFWSLFLPLYWLLMSIAAVYAFIELILRPHYWQKTQHGLSAARQRPTRHQALHPQLDQSLPDLQAMPGPAGMIQSITTRMRAIATLTLPTIAPTRKHRDKSREWNIGLLATMSIAVVASLIALLYYYHQNQILLYADAHSHLSIARRLFDSTDPYDIAQLGAVWLPLPHMLMWPFVWNDFLWRSGLAGSFVAMPCYWLATYFIYKTAFRLTQNSMASLIGALAFALNPDVLYIQVTPLSEMVCAATFTGASYFFLCWLQERKTKMLFSAALLTFLATWSRYDGWALFLVVLVGVGVLDLWRREPKHKIVSDVLIYGVPGGFGIVLWLLWSQVFFGDALYFQNGPYSSQSQQIQFLQAGTLFAYHNLVQALRSYGADVVECFGPIIVLLAFLGLLWLIQRSFRKPELFFTLIVLTPLAFYVYSLYSGQAVIFVPGLEPANTPNHLFNVRYGIAMGPSCAICVACLVSALKLPRAAVGKWLAYGGRIALLLLIITQVILTASGGNVTLQDGQQGMSCATLQQANLYLAQYYHGGTILEDNFIARVDGDDADFDFRNVIYEGSGSLWLATLKNPALATWVIAYPGNPADPVEQRIQRLGNVFQAQFTLVAQQPDGIYLYHRNSDPLVKVRSIPQSAFTEYALCKGEKTA